MLAKKAKVVVKIPLKWNGLREILKMLVAISRQEPINAWNYQCEDDDDQFSGGEHGS